MHRLQFRRYLGFLIIIALSITAVSFLASSLIRRETYRRSIGVLEWSNQMTGNILTSGRELSVGEFVDRIASDDVRITIIREDGVVIADSRADIRILENHAGRPEFAAAMRGETGQARRVSSSTGTETLYVARPPVLLNGVRCVVRSSMSIDALNQIVAGTVGRIALTGLLTFLILSVLSWISEQRLTAPLRDIQKAARAYSDGNLDYFLNVPGPEDVKIVADTLNSMADALKSRLKEVTESRNELDAIFSGMKEAVVLLDQSLTVRHLNTSALNMIRSQDALGRSLIEVFKNSQLMHLAEQALGSHKPVEKVIDLTAFSAAEPQSGGPESGHSDAAGFSENGSRDLVVQVYASNINAGQPSGRGALVLVMNDITQNRKLENMRRDFVANVSHELKTPITNIKGYLETLSADLPKDTFDRFLDISVRNADRLNAILDDLLNLSRLEQEGGAGLDFESHPVEGIIASSFQSCAPKAGKRGITLLMKGQDSTPAIVNTLLMEQALTNLIDNAVKYSGEGRSVTVDVHRRARMVDISVSDSGIGIPAGDLPRIFERFYRIDKARSREQGGTGLGLAIVKHIAIVHNGAVNVTSSPGQGSTFTLSVPAGR